VPERFSIASALRKWDVVLGEAMVRA
jgi:hypothetical protein